MTMEEATKNDEQEEKANKKTYEEKRRRDETSYGREHSEGIGCVADSEGKKKGCERMCE